MHEIVLFPKHELDAVGSMMVLLDALIMVPDSPIAHFMNVVGISEAIVVVIVAGSRDQQRHSVNVVKLPDLNQVTNGQHHE